MWFCKCGNYTVIWSLLCVTNVLAAVIGKRDSEWSPPHSENERQWSVNDLWLCKYGSVSNGSKLAVRFRVGVGTELVPLQRV